jgi:hypothetical protein
MPSNTNQNTNLNNELWSHSLPSQGYDSLNNERDIKIAVVASNGWVLRNLLETNLLADTALIDKVIVFLDKRIAKEGARLLDGNGVQYVVVDFRFSGLLLTVKSLLLYLEVFKNAPNYSENKFRGLVKVCLLSFLKALRLVRLLEPIHRLVRYIFEWFLKREARSLSLPEFDIFLSATPNAVQDNLVAMRSRFYGRSVVNLILSWDNIYSKGYMAPADLYVVWGDVMSKQLSNLHDIPKSSVFALGAPHIGGIKLHEVPDVQRDTLLYSTAAAVHFPDEKELVEKIANDFLRGVFPGFARLVVRTHPAGPNSLYDDLANPTAGIIVDHPTSIGKREITQWVPDANELQHLGEQLSRVSVAVNMASTMSLDCLVHGIEVINVTFAMNGRDISRHYRSEHYAGLLDLDIVRLAGSYEELVSAINNPDKTTVSNVTQRLRSFIRPTDKDVLRDFRAQLLNLVPSKRVAP